MATKYLLFVGFETWGFCFDSGPYDTLTDDAVVEVTCFDSREAFDGEALFWEFMGRGAARAKYDELVEAGGIFGGVA